MGVVCGCDHTLKGVAYVLEASLEKLAPVVLCRHCGNAKLRQQYLYLSFRFKKMEADK